MHKEINTESIAYTGLAAILDKIAKKENSKQPVDSIQPQFSTFGSTYSHKCP